VRPPDGILALAKKRLNGVPILGVEPSHQMNLPQLVSFPEISGKIAKKSKEGIARGSEDAIFKTFPTRPARLIDLE
jgi:hypothetical protein